MFWAAGAIASPPMPWPARVVFTFIPNRAIAATIVEAAGTHFAGPTQLTYLAGDPAVEPGKPDAPSARR